MLSLGVKCLVLSYIGAAALANLAVAHFGQIALVFTATILIPFDLVSRDVLHERWTGDRLLLRMCGLIAAGGLVSFAINAESARIGIASFCAFVTAGLIDMTVYHLARKSSRLVRMNVSNIFSSATDSMVFPMVAFAVVDPALSLSQFISKLLGGFAWSVAFNKFWRK